MTWWSACALAGLLALAWWGGRATTYALFPPTRSFDLPASCVPSRTVTILSIGGRPFEVWLFDAARPRGMVLVCHGFYGHRRQVASLSAALASQGYTTLLWDLPGHGDRRQEPCTFGTHELQDIGSILSWTARDARLASLPAAVLGWSFGGAIACQAAARYPAFRAVVLDSAYARLYPAVVGAVRRGGRRVPALTGGLIWIGLHLVLRTRLSAREPLRLASALTQPVFMMHGEADQSIPVDDTRALCRAWRGPAECWIEPGIGHVGLFAASPQQYTERVATFLNQWLAPSPQLSPS